MKNRAQDELDRGGNLPYRGMINDLVFCYEMNGAVCRLYEVDRACFAVPMLYTYIEEWYKYVHKFPEMNEYDEHIFIRLYDEIISMLEAASTEDNIPAQYQMPYDEMIAEYKRRVAELTDTGYRIRNPKEE